jgi:D-arginine dehydrogenase
MRRPVERSISMSSRTEILIVGAGIAGVSLASQLAHRHSVTIVEAESAIGYHATGRSAAMYLAGYGNDVVRALTRASRSFLNAPPAVFADGPILSPRGLLTVAHGGETTAFDQPHYLGQQSLSAHEAAAIVPILRTDRLAGAMIDHDAAEVDTDRLHQGYARAAREAGAMLHLDTRMETACRRDGKWHVTTSKGELSADVVVNAAGAWADAIAARFGARPRGLIAARRTAMLVEQPADMAGQAWPMVMTASEDLYFKPDAGLLLISPADETPAEPGDAQPEEWDIALAVDRFETLCEMPVRRIRHRWAGLRTFAPDRTPIVGHDADIPGFFWFAGQGGYGLQMAPALARLGAAIFDGHDVVDDLPSGIEQAVSPSRFDSIG